MSSTPEKTQFLKAETEKHNIDLEVFRKFLSLKKENGKLKNLEND